MKRKINKLMTKFFAIAMSVMMLVTLVPQNVFADTIKADPIASPMTDDGEKAATDGTYTLVADGAPQTIELGSAYEVTAVSNDNSVASASVDLSDGGNVKVYIVPVSEGETVVKVTYGLNGETVEKNYKVIVNKQEEAEENYYTLTVALYYEGSSAAFETYVREAKEGEAITIPVGSITGYTAHEADDSDAGYKPGVISSVTKTMDKDYDVDVVYVANEQTYTVRHVYAGNKAAETETLSGKYGDKTQAQAKTVPGYINKAFAQTSIGSDTVVTINYVYSPSIINFDSQGGSFVDPIEVNVDSVTPINATPTKIGYTFNGWYTAATGGTKVTSLSNVTSDTTVYAQWTPKEVNYTINYWKQKVTDDVNATDAQKTYDFAESVTTNKGLAGSAIPTNNLNNKSYAGFDYNNALTQAKNTDVTIAPDGTTVINVYYDRKICTVNFKLYNSTAHNSHSAMPATTGTSRNPAYTVGQVVGCYTCTSAVQTGGSGNSKKYAYTWELTCTKPNGLAQGWYTDSSVSGLYGADLPESTWRTDHYWYTKYSNGSASGTGCLLLTSFDFKTAGYGSNSGNVTATDGTVTTCNFYGTNVSSGRTIYYYNEQYDGTFKRVDAISTASGGTVTIREKYTGYDLYKYTTGSQSGDLTKASWWTGKTNCADGTQTTANTIYIASTLKSNKLVYWNVNAEAKSETIKYTTPYITTTKDYSDYTPSRPSIYGDYYEFAGWYADPACTTPFDFTSTMPNANVQIYAKWEAKDMDVNVHFELGPDNTEVKTVTVKGGTALSEEQVPAAPTASGYTFKGWYKDAAYTTPYSYNEPIETADLHIYAKWEEKTEADIVVKCYDAETLEEIKTETSIANIGESIDVTAPRIDGYNVINNAAEGYYVEQNITVVKAGNTVSFYYKDASKERFYKVVYVDEKGATLAESDVLSNNKKPSLTYKLTAPEGYVCVNEEGAQIKNITVEAQSLDNTNPTVYTVVCVKNELDLTVENGEWVYNAEAHSKTASTKTTGATVEYLVNGAWVTTAPSITDVGSKTVTARVWKKGFTTKTATYTLEVTPAPVTVVIKENSGEYVYNGTVREVTGYSVKSISSNLYKEASISYVGGNANKVSGIVAGSYDMLLKPEHFDNADSNFEVTFEIEDGKLVIKPITDKKIVVTANSNNQTYNGSALTDNGYTYTEGVLVTGDTLTAVVEGSATNVSDTKTGNNVVKSYKVTRTVDGKEVDVTSSYTFGPSVNGTLTINPRNVTIKSADGSKTYDGTPLTKNDPEKDITVTGDGFVEGEAPAYSITGTITDAGSEANAFTYTFAQGVDAGNYNIDKKEGTLTIAKKGDVVVTITEHSGTATYDGTEKTVSGYDVSSTDPKYTEKDFTFSGNDVVKGTNAGTYDMELSEKDFANKNGNYENVTFVIVDGSLVIDPIKTEIVVTAASDKKMYDGKALTNDGYTYTENVLVNGDTLTAVVEGTITNAGKESNVVKSYKVVNGKGEDVTKNYTFGDSKNGTLEVTQRSVIVTSDGGKKEYDGTALTKNDPEKNITVTGDGFVEGEGLVYTITGSQLDAGKSDNKFTYKPAEGTILANYKIQKAEGELEVTAKSAKIVVTANDAERAYNGEALTNATYKYTQNVLVNGDVLTAVVEGSATNVSDTKEGNNVVKSYKVTRTSDGKDVTDNYTFGDSVNGTLTILPVKVTIESAGGEKSYDGTPLTKNDPEKDITATGFVGNEGATYVITGSQLDLGESSNKFTYELKEGTLAENYDIQTKEGLLKVTVNKTKITITAKSDKKMYDGDALENNGYTYTENVLADGDELVAVVEGSATNVSDTKAGNNVVTSYKVVRTVEGKEVDVTRNYTFEESVPGTLTIEARNVTITSAGGSKTYDGTPLTKNDPETDITVTGDGFVEGEGATYDITGTITEVGEENNAFTYELKEGTLAENYNIETKYGTLIVSTPGKVVVVIKENSGEATYDGTEKEVTGYTVVSISNEAYTENDFQLKVEGKDTVKGITAGTYDMELAPSDFENISSNFDEVEFQIEDGTLVIKAIETKIVVKADSDEKMYDGKALTKDTYTYTENVLVEGDTLTAVVEGTITDFGTENNVVKSYRVTRTIDGKEVDVTASYTFGESENGTLKINKRDVVLTSADGSKTYDGTPLTKNEQTDVTVSGSGFVGTDGATYDITGTQTLVGESKNAFTYKLNDGVNAENYSIETKEGTLKVTDEKVEPSLVVTKTAPDKKYELGEKVEFTIKAKNIYDHAETITLVEQQGVELAKSIFEGVEAGKEVSTKATYTITETDILAGSFKNTVEATLLNVTAKAEATVKTADKDAKIKVTKTSDTNGEKVSLGDTITYTITVANEGNVTVYDIKVVDTLSTENAKVTYVPGTGYIVGNDGNVEIASIAPNAKPVEITATYVVTEADILAGEITNAATAAGSDPEDVPVDDDDKVTDETDPQNGELDVNKTSVITGKDEDGKEVEKTAAGLGDTITYTVVVTNTGNLTVNGIVLVDEMKDVVLVEGNESIGTLAPGKDATVKYTYTVTEADILATEVENVAKATGTASNNEAVEAKDNVVDGTEQAAPSIKVEKTSDVEGKASLGDTITYTIKVTNNGNVTIKDIAVEDELTGNTGDNALEVGTLAPGESKEVTATYVVTEDDIIAGHIYNKATATGTDPEDEPTPDDDDTDDVTDDVVNSISVSKTSDTKGEEVALGDTITYTITVTNDGNVTISDIEVVDTLSTENAKVTFVEGEGYTIKNGKVYIDSIAPVAEGETPNSVEITATYVVTEADILAGEITNAVTATGKDPEKTPTTDDTTVTDETEEASGSLTVEKISDMDGEKVELGDEINYTITVTNDGNVTVSGIVVEDTINNDGSLELTKVEADNGALAKIGRFFASLFSTNDTYELAPGESMQFTATYTVVEDDIVRSEIVNVATATGSDPNGEEVTGTDDNELETVDINAALSIVKDNNETTAVALGHEINYTITVANIGNVTVSDIVVTDTIDGAEFVAGTGYTIDEQGVAHIESIAPVAEGEPNKVVLTVKYTVTEDDVHAGKIENIATVTGKDPKNEEVTDVTKEETPVETPAPSIAVVKESSADGSKVSLGDEITYTITVTNNGNVTVNDIVVVDEMAREGAEVTYIQSADYTIGEDGNVHIASIAPNADPVVITASYVVVEADILATKITNKVTAQGTTDEDETPGDDSEITDDTDDLDSTIDVTKTSDVAEGEKVSLGQTITYTISVKNLGNVTVSDITVSDVIADQDKQVTIVSVAGDVEDYTINDDNTVTLGAIAPVADGEPNEVIITATYVVTEEDILAGSVKNAATANGSDPNGDPSDDDDDVEDPTDDPDSTIKVTKTSDVAKGETVSLGQTITYEIKVENLGNVTVNDITVTDELEGVEIQEGEGYTVNADGTATIESIAPVADGEPNSVVITATYVVTEDDIINGSVKNAATANGSDPNGDPTDDDDDVEDPTDDPDNTISVVKTSVIKGENEDGEIVEKSVAALNDVIYYTIKVYNYGNVTISNIVVDDQLEGVVIDESADYTVNADGTVTIESIAPVADGEEAVPVVITASYVVTEADVIADSVINTVTVTGDDPIDDPDIDDPSDDDDVEDPTEEKNSSLFIRKTSDAEGKKLALGETVTYTIEVINNGNVTISDITVTDELEGVEIQAGEGYTVNRDGTAGIASLEPGADAVVITATYVVTEDDIIAGSVKNAATASGTDPEDIPTDDDDDVEDPTEDPDNTITVEKKVVGATSGYKAGDTVTYSLIVTNKGNVTVENIAVDDELAKYAGTITKLAPGEEVTIQVTYVVTIEDAVAGSVVNVATVNGTDPNGDPTDDEDDVTVTTDDTYTLTIHYVDGNGNTLAADYVGTYHYGETFGPIYSPAVAGYTPEYSDVSSDAAGMPAFDVEVTVVYSRNITPPVPGPDDPEPEPEPEPKPGQVDPDPDGPNIVPVTPDNPPLGPVDGNHRCCILHFLLMILALILLCIYTSRRKKNQEAIQEMKEELALEQKKRGITPVAANTGKEAK